MRTAATIAAAGLVCGLLAGCSAPATGPLAGVLEKPQTSEDRIGTVINMGRDDTIDPASVRYLAVHNERTYFVGRLDVAKQLCLIVVHADSVDWEAASCGTLPVVADWDGAHGSGKARLVADGADVEPDMEESDDDWTVLTPNLAVAG
jgi:hypothetical protein